MNQNNVRNKPIIAVSLALILVLLLVIGLFAFGQPDAAHADITLPEVQAETDDHESEPKLSEDTLLQVTPQNAVIALESLKKPEYYHQAFNVSIGEENANVTYSVELWVNGTVRRAEITGEQDTKIILCDEKEAYIWYASDKRSVLLELSEDVTFEDILGLPAFDYLQTLRSLDVTDAEYLVIEEVQNETPCIFVSLQEHSGAITRYWIDLTSGLLYQADCVEDNTQVYRVDQTAFDRLANGDETFSEKFLLPDGSAVFTAETEMPQQQ